MWTIVNGYRIEFRCISISFWFKKSLNWFHKDSKIYIIYRAASLESKKINKRLKSILREEEKERVNWYSQESQWFTSFKWLTSKWVTCNDRVHKFAFKIVVSEMNDLQTKEFILVFLLLLLLLLFPFIHSTSIGIKSHLFHYRHVICRMRWQTAKMQIPKEKSVLKFHFVCQKASKVAVSLFFFFISVLIKVCLSGQLSQ